MNDDNLNLLQGTLDILVLKALSYGPQHGYAVARWIRETTDDALQIEEGALYTALHRLEKRGWMESDWGLCENNRRAKFYGLTTAGEAAPNEDPGLGPATPRPSSRCWALRRGRWRMKTLPGLRRFFRLGAFRPDPEGDLDEELAFHFQQTEEELLAQGFSPAEAREEARRRFGDLDRYRKELSRIDRRTAARSRRLAFLEAVAQDLAYVAPGHPAGTGLHGCRGPHPGPGDRGQRHHVRRGGPPPPEPSGPRSGSGPRGAAPRPPDLALHRGTGHLGLS